MTSSPMLDTIIVGGGIAGLAAAHQLRDRRIVVLEAADRPGGRIHSHPAGPYWLNLGAHMFGGPGSTVGNLVAELGLDSRPIRGELLGIAAGGRRLLRGRLETMPLRMALPLAARASLIRMGLALRLGSDAAVRALRPRQHETRAERRARVHAFRNDATLAAALNPQHPAIIAFLDTITERTGGAPDEMAAGYALRSFANVWSRHSPGFNLHGGSAMLPRALAAELGGRLQLGAQVSAVRQHETGVLVDYVQDGESRQVEARSVIVATPAYVTARILRDAPEPLRAALRDIRYGAFLTMAVLTRETSPMPWDGNYAITTPDRSFSALFNQATSLRTGPRQPGGSIMLFRGARGAALLMELTDSQIEAKFMGDLFAEFPEAKGLVDETVLQRWPAGAPYSWPGRAALQARLTAPLGAVFLAGDYLEFPNMEAAAETGIDAAQSATAYLAANAVTPA